MVALSGWQQERVCIGRPFCGTAIVSSVVCCGAVPFIASVGANSATVAFSEYRRLLRTARWLLRRHPDVMLLADRGNACS